MSAAEYDFYLRDPRSAVCQDSFFQIVDKIYMPFVILAVTIHFVDGQVVFARAPARGNSKVAANIANVGTFT